jgi:hypothetical protein
MKIIIITIISISIILSFFYSCKDEGSKTDPPGRVIIVEKEPGVEAEADTLEKGIDAIPGLNAIFMEWHPNKEENLAGYSIYRSESFNVNFVSIGKVVKYHNAIDSFYIDDNDSINTRFYYYIRAFNDLDQYGDPSDTITYKLLDYPILSDPNQANRSNSPQFVWYFGPESQVPHSFIFRLQKKVNEVYINYYTKVNELGDDYDYDQVWELNEITDLDSLMPGIYQWRIDPIGSEPFHGSESDWRGFPVD